MKRRTIVGIIFVVAALLKLVDIWDIMDLEWLWNQPWKVYIGPLLILYIGIELIISSYQHHPDQWLERPVPSEDEGKRICCSVHYGGDKYVYRGEVFHGARLDAFCGGIQLDIREAVILENEEIDIHTFLGGIEIFVPQHVNVIVKSRSFIGGVGNEAARNVTPGTPCLHISASNFFGGVSIKN